ncbi:hypothetical protein PENTCL1PPCAC_14816, partial [Pristionchus entomophagus]
MTLSNVNRIADSHDCFLATELKEIELINEEAKKTEYKPVIIWSKVVLHISIHLGALYGLYLAVTVPTLKTWIWGITMLWYGGTGITAGSHRLWTHKSYKANYWVRLFLLVGQTIATEGDVIDWTRDHRTHHKWSDSDADPHNIQRGFFFAHMGWLMQRKHPKVKEMGAKIDLSDLYAVPMLRFQRKYYVWLVLLSFVIITAVPYYGWGETFE